MNKGFTLSVYAFFNGGKTLPSGKDFGTHFVRFTIRAVYLPFTLKQGIG